MKKALCVILVASLAIVASSREANALFIATSSGDTIVATTGDEVSTGPHPLGFTFPFFGASFTSVFVNSNGDVSLGGSLTYAGSLSLPVTAPGGIGSIFALGDDLVVQPGNLRINASTPGQFVAIWNGVGIFGESGSVTAEAVLLGPGNPFGVPSGTIVLSYDAITNVQGSDAAVGLNKGDGAAFATLSSVLGTSANGQLSEAQATSLLPFTTYTFTPTSSTTYSVAAGGPAVEVVPEPGTLLLLGSGLAGLATRCWRRRAKARRTVV